MHTIALRGPWEISVAENDSPSDRHELPSMPQPGEQQLAKTLKPPVQLSDLVEFSAGSVRFTRWFNCPTGLTPNSIVHISLHPPLVPGELSLDRQLLTTWQEGPAQVKHDITARLQPRMQLSITVNITAETSPAAILLPDTVRLEIS